MGDLGLSLAILRRLSQGRREPAGYLAWADGSGGAWHQDHGIWIRDRCGYPEPSVVHAWAPDFSVGESNWDRSPAPRAASPAERAAFLRPLPVWNGIVVGRTAAGLAVALDEKPGTASTRAVQGSTRACLFDRVRARLAGGELITERVVGSGLSAQLRTSFQQGLRWPERFDGAAAIFRRAYDCARDMAAVETLGDLSGRVSAALWQGCARPVDWRLLPAGELSVVWTPLIGPLRGETIETRACAQTFAVRSAGICVSSRDREFDLASLASAVANRAMDSIHAGRRL
jgi:hypothetical protein